MGTAQSEETPSRWPQCLPAVEVLKLIPATQGESIGDKLSSFNCRCSLGFGIEGCRVRFRALHRMFTAVARKLEHHYPHALKVKYKLSIRDPSTNPP